MGARLGRHLAEGHAGILFWHGTPPYPWMPHPSPHPRSATEWTARAAVADGRMHVKGSAHVPAATTSWWALDGEPGRAAAGCGGRPSSIRRMALNACCAASARTTEASVA